MRGIVQTLGRTNLSTQKTLSAHFLKKKLYANLNLLAIETLLVWH